MGDKAEKAVQYAKSQIGKPYVWGAQGPNAFDCSGLSYRAYKSVGIDIGRTTYQQIKKGKPVSRKNLQPGDLVFTSPGHVMMYAGDGKTIEAANPRSGIKQSNVYRFYAARRYDNGGSSGGSGGSGGSSGGGSKDSGTKGPQRKAPDSGSSRKAGPKRSVGSSGKSGSSEPDFDWDHSPVVIGLVLVGIGFVGYKLVKGL